MTSQESRATPSDEADEIDLRQLLGTLIDHKWWIAGITGLCLAVAASYALLATPIYVPTRSSRSNRRCHHFQGCQT